MSVYVWQFIGAIFFCVVCVKGEELCMQILWICVKGEGLRKQNLFESVWNVTQIMWSVCVKGYKCKVCEVYILKVISWDFVRYVLKLQDEILWDMF